MPAPKMPPHVAAWKRATGKDVQAVSAQNRIEKKRISGAVPARCSADWFKDCVEGLDAQRFDVEFHHPSSVAGLRSCWLIRPARHGTSAQESTGTGPDLASALEAAILALPKEEAK